MKRNTILLFVAFCLGIVEGNAQYTVLHKFNGINGAMPEGTLTLAGKKLYGMTSLGGAYNLGCIFSIDTTGNNYKDMYDLNSTSGDEPLGALTIIGNKLYGMTFHGGTDGFGDIFSIDTNGVGFKILLDFNSTNGSFPYGDLTLSGNKLYGMTDYGGIYNWGCIFSIDTNGSDYKKIFDFNGTNGLGPLGSLTISGKMLYGITHGGGIYALGTIFSIDTNGNGYRDLLDFNDTNGGEPYYTTLVLSRGTLYSMTQTGGVNNRGCVFGIDTNGTHYKDLFDFDCTNGQYPLGSLILSGSVLYGMTYQSNCGLGNIFSIDTNGDGFINLYELEDTNGIDPTGSLIISGNTLYGMTGEGGIAEYGVIFSFKDTSITTSIKELSTTPALINVFPNPSNGIFTIKFLGTQNFVSGNIEVYNVMGQKVFSQFNIQNSTFNIDHSGQPDGVYLYRVISKNGDFVGEGKLVIEK